MKPCLRIIGDVHQKYCDNRRMTEDGWIDIPGYESLVKGAGRSIQIGDLGFNYSPLYWIDKEFHKVLTGNHDNIDNRPHHDLGDFGVYNIPEFGDIFFVRGGFSIDHVHRVYGRDLFVNEELNLIEAEKALELYKSVKPDFMLSHDAPLSLVPENVEDRHFTENQMPLPYISNPWMDVRTSNTQRLLQAMLDFHQPDRWYFGHFHISWTKKIGNTTFRCLKELEYVDLNENREEINGAN